MKRICILIVILALAVTAAGQIPTKFSYQGIVENPPGSPVTGDVEFVFRIYDAAVSGNLLWDDSDTLYCDQGYFHAFLGENTPLDPNDFNGQRLWLEIWADGNLLPDRQEYVSVGYAFKSISADVANHALHADTATVALNVSGSYDSCLWQSSGDDIYRLNGKVGIGTPSPSDMLHIYGAARADLKLEGSYSIGSTDVGKLSFAYGLRPAGTNERNIALINAYNTTTDETSGGYLAFWTRQAGGSMLERMHISSDGNVGIGLTSPSAKLHVIGPGSGPTLRIEDSVKPMIQFSDGVTAGGYIYQISSTSIAIGNSSETDKCLIINQSSGNVGIGTGAPAALLHTYSNSAEEGACGGILIDQDGSGDAGLSFRLVGVVNYAMGVDNSDSDKFKISYGSNLGSNDRLVINSLGNVGIGTASPVEKIHVEGNARITGSLCVLGQKNAVVPTSQGMTKVYCDESTEIWFSDRGKSKVTGGSVEIFLDPLFLETVTINEDHPMMVQVTPVWSDPVSFSVMEKSTSFIIRCDHPVTFNWRVEAKRKGYEDVRLEPMN